MRQAAGLSQRALAAQAGTSQPAVARYESGATAPTLETLQRLAAACGWRLRIDAEPVPDAGDVELAEALLRMTPAERLQTLSRFARLRSLAEKRE